MATTLMAVQRYYRGGNIDSYDIQDIKTGEVRHFSAHELKSLLAQKKLSVANLQFTSDGRLNLITDDTRIINNMEYDGRSDNNIDIDNISADQIMYDMLTKFDSWMASVKVKSFNKDTNTFVISFNDGRMLKHSLDILIKYTMEPTRNRRNTRYVEEVCFRMMPMALRFRGKTYPVKITADYMDDYTMQVNVNGYKIRNKYTDMGCGDTIRDAFTPILSGAMCAVLHDDEKALRGLQAFVRHTDIDKSEFRARDKKALLTTSALTYGILGAFMIMLEDPETAKYLTLCCGTLLNYVLQTLRRSTTYPDY